VFYAARGAPISDEFSFNPDVRLSATGSLASGPRVPNLLSDLVLGRETERRFLQVRENSRSSTFVRKVTHPRDKMKMHVGKPFGFREHHHVRLLAVCGSFERYRRISNQPTERFGFFIRHLIGRGNMAKWHDHEPSRETGIKRMGNAPPAITTDVFSNWKILRA
jgi:hypothetical protein